jgi:hypothetical protein
LSNLVELSLHLQIVELLDLGPHQREAGEFLQMALDVRAPDHQRTVTYQPDAHRYQTLLFLALSKEGLKQQKQY